MNRGSISKTKHTKGNILVWSRIIGCLIVRFTDCCFFTPVFTQDYFDRRNETKSQLQLTKATVSKVEVVGMGDRVCVDLCSIMRPGEGLLVCVISHPVPDQRKEIHISVKSIQLDVPMCHYTSSKHPHMC